MNNKTNKKKHESKQTLIIIINQTGEHETDTTK